MSGHNWDPYLWLEDHSTAAVQAWVRERSASVQELLKDRWANYAQELQSILQDPHRIVKIHRCGRHIYSFVQIGALSRGFWRRAPWKSFRNPNVDWEMLLDIDELSRDEQIDWAWKSALVGPNEKRALIGLSANGVEHVKYREFDLVEKKFIEDGLEFPSSLAQAVWLDSNRIAFVDGQTVRVLERYKNVSEANIIFEASGTCVNIVVESDPASKCILIRHFSDIFSARNFVYSGAVLIELALPSSSIVHIRGDWISFQYVDSSDQLEKLAVTKLHKSLLQLAPAKIVAVASEKRSLLPHFWSEVRIVIGTLEKGGFRYNILNPATGEEVAVPMVDTDGIFEVETLDSEAVDQDGTLLATVEDLLTPRSLFVIRNDKINLLQGGSGAFDSKGLSITRHSALSEDGTEVPYIQVGPAGQLREAPVYMMGYGAFGVPQLPYYSPALGKLWLERGGIGILAQIRGGGEFGPAWHEAAKREKKFRSHQDFAAVAEDLVERNITKPQLIVGEGWSNGGLLVANMLTHYPERFGAFVCHVPLTDMRRYSKLGMGSAWIPEYGDPDSEFDWEHLVTISPYHNVERRKEHPPILITAVTGDNSVHPAHARKMAAKLKDFEHDVYFYEFGHHGHNSGTNNKEYAEMVALGFAFARQIIGLE